MITILIVIITFFIILIVSWFIKYVKYEKYLKNIPGPTPLPLLGNALLFPTRAVLITSLKICEKYGKIIKLRIGFRNPALLITDVKAVEFILSSTTLLEKSPVYQMLQKWLGLGLLTSEGEKWKKHRKMLTPAFHFSILEQFISIFNTFSSVLMQKLELELGNESFDIYPYISLYSLDVICATSLGTNVNAQKNSDSLYVSNIMKICKIILSRVISPIKSNNFLYRFTRDHFKEKKIIKIVHNYTESVIASRKIEYEKLSNSTNKANDMGIKNRLSFLDLMLQQKMERQYLTDQEIREEVDTFTFEGHDTTSSGISFTLYCLANNLDVQNRVIEELEVIFADEKGRQPTYRDLQAMKYLEMAIKESLRLYPPVPLFSRGVANDTEYNGIILPKGLILSVYVFGMHRCADYYPDPERFDPERFTAENQRNRSPYAYVPFSAGSRNCIGQKFAMLEMKSIISTILRKFEILPPIPVCPLDLSGNIILKSDTGVHLRLQKRNFEI